MASKKAFIRAFCRGEFALALGSVIRRMRFDAPNALWIIDNLPMPRKLSLHERLSQILDADPTERRVHDFLKRNLLVVSNALNQFAWNSVNVISEFKFGADYRADFLILSADSGAWYATLIELESPTSKPFTLQGNPSAALSRGLAQIDEWAIWLANNDGSFRDRLSKYLLARHEAASCSNTADHVHAHTEIRDTRTVIHIKTVVVVGRRGQFDAEAQQRRGVYSERGQIISSFDRFLAAAKQIDQASD